MSAKILAELEAATQRINAFAGSMETGNPDATAIADVMSDVGTFVRVTVTVFQALTELMGQIDKGEFRDALGQDLKCPVREAAFRADGSCGARRA